MVRPRFFERATHNQMWQTDIFTFRPGGCYAYLIGLLRSGWHDTVADSGDDVTGVDVQPELPHVGSWFVDYRATAWHVSFIQIEGLTSPGASSHAMAVARAVTEVRPMAELMYLQRSQLDGDSSEAALRIAPQVAAWRA